MEDPPIDLAMLARKVRGRIGIGNVLTPADLKRALEEAVPQVRA